MGIKDSIDIEGFATRLGSPCFADAPPAQRHAKIVRALLDGGCRILGKTNMHELAYGATGINRWTGTPVNPRARGRLPGGSSSGSAAAVATQLVDFAIGTDTGGSIRIPSTCCGVYGLKPSYGRLSRSGVHPAISSLDCVGPLARDIRTIEGAMQILDPSFHPHAPPSQATVGWIPVDASPAVAAIARNAVDRANVSVRPISLPAFEAAFAAGLVLIGWENWTAYGHLVGNEALGSDVRARLLAARDISVEQIAAAEKVRQTFQTQVNDALCRVDALALPTLPDFPVSVEAAADWRIGLRLTSLVRPFNLSGHPAISLPVAAADSLPVGLQLVGRHGADEALCALAAAMAASDGLAFPRAVQQISQCTWATA